MAGISVHVRVRPTSQQSAWATADTCLYPTKSVGGQDSQPFVFNKVHSAAATNESIFHSVEPLVHAAFDGRNVTVMAYGQTGSGKTHTMIGGHDDNLGSKDRGIIPRVAHLLLSLKNAAGQEGTTIDASCIELYNEKVQDLMDNKQEVQLRDVALDGTVTFERVGIAINSYQDYLSMSQRYEQARAKNVTDLNHHSSRSHMMLCFTITRPNRVPSCIYLVDLAGSESASKAHTEGATQREGGFINKSLLALGNVVTALVEGRLPVYRESKLTRLLRGCLQGGFTFMIATVNPDPGNHEQTVTALKFAQRAMKMKADPTQLLTMVPLEGIEYVDHLKQMMRTYEDRCRFAHEESMAQTYKMVQPFLQDKAASMNHQTQEAMTEWQLARVALVARERLRYVMTVKNLQTRGSQYRDKHQQAANTECEQRDLCHDLQEKEQHLKDMKQEIEFRVQEKRQAKQDAIGQADFQLEEQRSQIYPIMDQLLDEEATDRDCLLADEMADWALGTEHLATIMRKSHYNSTAGTSSSQGQSHGPGFAQFHVYSVDNAAQRRNKMAEFQQKLTEEREDTNELKNAYEMLHGTALSVPMDHSTSRAANNNSQSQQNSRQLSHATSFGDHQVGTSQQRHNQGDHEFLTDEGFDQKLLALEHQRQYLEDEMAKERYSGRHTGDQRYSGATPQQRGGLVTHGSQPLRSPTPQPSPYQAGAPGADDDLLLEEPRHQQVRPLPQDHQSPQLAITTGRDEEDAFGIGAGDVSLYLEEDTPPVLKNQRNQPQRTNFTGRAARSNSNLPTASQSQQRGGSKRELMAASNTMNDFQSRFLNTGSAPNSRLPSSASSAMVVPPPATTSAVRAQFSQQRSEAHKQQSSHYPTARTPLGSVTPTKNNNVPVQREKSTSLMIASPHVGQKRGSEHKDPSPPDTDQQSMSRAEVMAIKRREAAEKAKVTRARNKAAKEALADERARARKEKMAARSKSLSESPTPNKYGTPGSASGQRSTSRQLQIQYRETSDNVHRSLEF